MKISSSKKELARIISENGGWRDGCEWSALEQQGGDVWLCAIKPIWNVGVGIFSFKDHVKTIHGNYKLPNIHQAILSRAEYFHLYPAPDADGWIEWKGGECPVGGDVIVACKVRTGKEFRNGKKIKASILRWRHTGGMADIIAYRLCKPEQAKNVGAAVIGVAKSAPEAKPTIEQLASDYRNARDYADRKQQEADAAKADAEAKLKALTAAGRAIDLYVSPITAKQEQELVINDWLDLRVGDEVEYAEGLVEEREGLIGRVVETMDDGDGLNVRLELSNGEFGCPTKWRFIRRP